MRTHEDKREQLGTPGDKHEQLRKPEDKQKQLRTHEDKQEQLGTSEDKQEQLGTSEDKQKRLRTPGKEERRGEFSSLGKRTEKFIDVNRNTRSTHGHLGRIGDSEGYKGTGGGIKKHSLLSQGNLEKVFSPETGISNNCSSKEEIKSERGERQCQGGKNSDPKIVPKNSRKRTPRPRKPRGRDTKTAPKTLSKVPSKVPSDTESKVEGKERKLQSNKHEISQEALKKGPPKTSVTLAVESKIEKKNHTNEQKLSKNVSNLQNAPCCDVTATKPSLRRPPPGFESVTP